jgi:hypothetical protein
MRRTHWRPDATFFGDLTLADLKGDRRVDMLQRSRYEAGANMAAVAIRLGNGDGRYVNDIDRLRSRPEQRHFIATVVGLKVMAAVDWFESLVRGICGCAPG